MAAYRRVDDVHGHLRVDCLYTSISSWPNARCQVWESLPLRYRPNCITLSSSLADRDQLASRSGTSSRAASELDEDLRVHVVCVSYAKFHYAVLLVLAGRRPVRDQIPLRYPACE